jgi:predicted GNAT family acetyltransferase
MPAMDIGEPVIVDDTAQSRFEVRVAGELVGFAQYCRRGGLIAFVHTEIDERYAGQGLAGRLIAHALDASREEGLAVLPFCPFVRDYIDEHREYLDLVPPAQRDHFDLAADA